MKMRNFLSKGFTKSTSPEATNTVITEEAQEAFKNLLTTTLDLTNENDKAAIEDAVEAYRHDYRFVGPIENSLLIQNHRLIGYEIKNALERKGAQTNYLVLRQLIQSFVGAMSEIRPSKEDKDFTNKRAKYDSLKEFHQKYLTDMAELESQFPPIDFLSSQILGGAIKSEIKNSLKIKGVNLEQKHLDLIQDDRVNPEVKVFIDTFFRENYLKLLDLQTKLGEGLAAKEGVDDLLYNKVFVQSIEGDFVESMFAKNYHPELIRLVLESGVKLQLEDVKTINDEYRDKYKSYGSVVVESLLAQYLEGRFKNPLYKAEKSLTKLLLTYLEDGIADVKRREKAVAIESLGSAIGNWKPQSYGENPDMEKVGAFKQILELSCADQVLIEPSDDILSNFVSEVMLTGSDVDIAVLINSGFFDIKGSKPNANDKLIKGITSALGNLSTITKWDEDVKKKYGELLVCHSRAAAGITLSQELENLLEMCAIKNNSKIVDLIEKNNQILNNFKDGDPVDDLKAALGAFYVSGDVKKYCVKRNDPKISEILESAINKSDFEIVDTLINLDCFIDKFSIKETDWDIRVIKFIDQANGIVSEQLENGKGENFETSVLGISYKLAFKVHQQILEADGPIFTGGLDHGDMMNKLLLTFNLCKDNSAIFAEDNEFNGMVKLEHICNNATQTPKTKPAYPKAQSPRGGAAAELSDDEKVSIRGSIR